MNSSLFVSLFPGCVTTQLTQSDEHHLIRFVQSSQAERECPCCNQKSNHVHSRYTRTLRDLPMSGFLPQAEGTLIIHATDARFDRQTLTYEYPNGLREQLLHPDHFVNSL